MSRSIMLGSNIDKSDRFKISNIFRSGQKSNNSNLVGIDTLKIIGSSGNRSKLFPNTNFSDFHRRINRPSISTGYQSYERLSTKIIGDLPGEEVRNIFVNNNPNVSRALNDFRKFVNPGWILEPIAHPLFARLFNNMGNYNEDLNILINGLSDSMFKDGATFTELILREDGDPRRIIGIPSFTAEFRQADGPDGEFSELGQYDMHEQDFFLSHHGDPTIKYYPLLPEIGNPYGRLIMDSSLYHLMMVKGFFQSYKDAISSIIWPNILITVSREELRNMSIDKNSHASVISSIIEQICTEVDKLGPGGVLAFGSEVKIDGPISGMNRTNLGMVTDCINIMNTEIMRALESESVLFGLTEGLAETHVTQQMRNYGYFINMAQEILNKLFTFYFSLILFVNESNERANFKMKKAIAEERLQLAQVARTEYESVEIKNEAINSLVTGIAAAQDRGLIDDVEAREMFQEGLNELRNPEFHPDGY